jgi:hypothetical protein
MSEPQMQGTIGATPDALRSAADTVAAAAAPSAVTATHDLTGDGRADIAGLWEDGVYVALNQGDGTFKPAAVPCAPLVLPPAGGGSCGTPASLRVTPPRRQQLRRQRRVACRPAPTHRRRPRISRRLAGGN